MRKGMILSSVVLLLTAVIPLAAQTQDTGATTAPAPKPKAKHVYDLRPLDEKCADPSVPAEDKTSCPKPPPDKTKGTSAAPTKAKKEVPIYDEYGSKLPVEPDVTKMGSDGLKDRIRGMQVQMDRSKESIDTWTKRQSEAKTDEEKASLQKLIDTSKEQLRLNTERKKEAEAQLATIKE
jgi:hypothetical protein